MIRVDEEVVVVFVGYCFACAHCVSEELFSPEEGQRTPRCALLGQLLQYRRLHRHDIGARPTRLVAFKEGPVGCHRNDPPQQEESRRTG